MSTVLASGAHANCLDVFVGTNESCAAKISAWEEIVRKMGGLTQAGTILVPEADSNPNQPESAAEKDSKNCTVRAVFLPPGEESSGEWASYTGMLLK